MMPLGAGATTVIGPIRLLIPFERPLPPLIYEADGQHAKEDHHRPEAVDADLLERDRPREQEAHLKVEDDEKNGDEIKPDVELHAGVIEGREAALIGRQF